MLRSLDGTRQRPVMCLWRVGFGATLCGVAASAGPIEDFYALEDEIVEAQEAYAEALEALEKNEGRKREGGASLPSDPRLGILKKMDALADVTAGKPAGGAVAIGTFMWSWNLDLDPERLVARLERVVKHYPNEPDVDEVLAAAIYAGTEVGKPDDWIKPLKRLSNVTQRKETKLGALFTLGQIQLAAGKLPEAKASFRRILESRVDSEYVASARGFIFEIEHLQVGMVAPDFVAKTLDGKEVSLRSLRGKAVLLSFWATW